MTDVLKHASGQRRSSTYLAFPLSLFRRRHSTQSYQSSPPPSTLASNDPLSEVMEIGQSSSTSQHTYSHADDPIPISPEDEERERLRDAAAQSLGLNLNALSDDTPENAESSESSLSRQLSKPPNTISYASVYETSSQRSGLLSSLATTSPNPMIYSPQSFNMPTKLPPYPCSYSELAPFIQISSSYLKFAAGTTNTTHASNGLAFISLPKRSKSTKTHWKLYYVVLTVPREYGSRALPSMKHSSFSPSLPQSPPYTSSNSSFHSLTSPNHFHRRNSPPPSSFTPSHSYLHLFKSEHPTRDEVEIDRLEINEDTVVYIADMELSGKKGLIKVIGRHVGATTTTTNDEELNRTLWILKYPSPRETTNPAPNNKVIYPNESEVQQRWVKEIKSSVLSQRAERAGFLHASSQPTSPRASWSSNPGSSSSPSNHGWHLPLSPNRQLSFFPQPRPSPPILPPPNPNPRYAEHIGAAPSAVSSIHPTSAHSSSSRLHSSSGASKLTGLRSLFQSPTAGGQSVLRDDSSIATKNRAASPMRTASRPSSRDGAGSVWSGNGVGIQRTTIKEEEKDSTEMPRHKDIHPLAPDEPTEDYTSFLKRLNTRMKDSLKAKEKEKIKRRPKSTGAVSDNPSASETVDMPDMSTQPTTDQNGLASEKASQFHLAVKRPSSPNNDMSVASIYSQSSAQDNTARETRSSRHSHKRSASTGTVGTSLFQTGPNQNVAEWIVSTTQAQAQGEPRTDKDLTDMLANHNRLRHNDRLSIGESLVISLSLKPRPRSQRRSTTINALAASALKEGWSFPPPDNSATVPSDGTETPGRTHPYSHPQAETSSDIAPFSIVEESHDPSQTYSFISPPASIPPSVRSSVDFKSREKRTSQTMSKNANLEKSIPHHEGENRSTGGSSGTEKDTHTNHNEQDCAPRPTPAKPARLSSILNSTSSSFRHSTPLLYKRVSAPPASSSLSNPIADILPPLRPPPSFAPPPPPSNSFTANGNTRNSEESIAGTKAISEMGHVAKDTVSASGSAGKGIEGSSLSRSFRLSLNPSPPPTQPLPPRPDEITVNGTITIVESQNDKHPSGQRQRPHSTLAGPRQKPYKTFPTDHTERPLFMSMYPMSASSFIPVDGANDHPGSLSGSSVPAPQPPPQGPLPPTPELTDVGNSRESSIESTSASYKRSHQSSTSRRMRIMSSPPLSTSNYESNDDGPNVNSQANSHFFDEGNGSIRPRISIPAPPKVPPPKPKKETSGRMSTMPNSAPGELSVEHGDSTLPSTFLHMDDTPKASIFPAAAENSQAAPPMDASLEPRSIETGTQPKPDSDDFVNEFTPFSQEEPDSWPLTHDESSDPQNSQIPETLKHDRNANLPYESHEIPTLFETYEASEETPQLENKLKLAEVDIGTGATVVMGRITPPSPSPLRAIAQTRSISPSSLSSDSCLQYEREEEDDFHY